MAKPLTKSQIVASVAETVGLTKAQTVQTLEALVALAYKNAKNSFTLPGLGKLVLVNRKTRMGRNPATGAAIKIPAKRVVKFRVAKAAKDAILGTKCPIFEDSSQALGGAGTGRHAQITLAKYWAPTWASDGSSGPLPWQTDLRQLPARQKARNLLPVPRFALAVQSWVCNASCLNMVYLNYSWFFGQTGRMRFKNHTT